MLEIKFRMIVGDLSAHDPKTALRIIAEVEAEHSQPRGKERSRDVHGGGG